MVELTFYGGVGGEVGGNTILLKDRKLDTAVLLDFGINYHRWSSYFNFPFSRPSDRQDLIRCGIIPKINGLYVGDVDESPIEACIVSHAHGDHYKYVSLLREKSRAYISECGHGIIKATEEVKEQKGFEDRFGERVQKGEVEVREFRTGDRLRIGGSGFEVEPIHVDHSLPGAYGFLIHTSSGLIAYTGDFRRHGTHSALTEDFMEAMLGCREKVRYLICEGTNIVRANPMTEEDVRRQTAQVVERADGLVIVDHSHADVDRIRTIDAVAKSVGRELVISKRIANTLHAFTTDRALRSIAKKILDDASIYYGPRKRWLAKVRRTRLEKKLEKLLGGKERFAEEVQQSPSRYLLGTNVSRFEDLRDLQPPPGSVYILSASEPFEEEREFDFERLLRWLDIYGIPLIHIHASGHAMPADIRDVVKAVRPDTFIPVHTEYPSLIGQYVSDCCRVEVPERGVPLNLNEG